MAPTGVVLLGFGGPDSLDAVEPFMAALTGRTPSPELVERVRGNYRAIGGKSPLTDIANGIAEDLAEALGKRGGDVVVRVGMRYWNPYIADALRELSEAGCERVVAVSLSPFESEVASGAYRRAIGEALVALPGMEVAEAPLVSTLPAFGDFLAESTRGAMSGVPDVDTALAVFTAHSLPEADLTADDPYVEGLRRIATLVGRRLGWAEGAENAGGQRLDGLTAFGTVRGPQPWLLAYQSKGARPGSWLGPTLDDLIGVAPGGGFSSLVVCPIGFMTDHMETLFDLDIVAAGQASEAGLGFVRAAVPNDDSAVVDGLAEAVAAII